MRLALRLIFALIALAFGTATYAEPRYALVIGISTYEGHPLPNARTDAEQIAKELENAGFNVLPKYEATKAETRTALNTLIERVNSGGNDATVFIYYAGHGAQIGDVTYLIPRDAAALLGVPADTLAYQDGAREAQTLLDVVVDRTRAKSVILVLDACRDDPGRSTTGIAKLRLPTNPRVSAFIGFATSENMTANDDGAYAKAIIDNAFRPGVSFTAAMTRVSQTIADRTKDTRRPQKPQSFGAVDLTMVALPSPVSVAAADPAIPIQNAASTGLLFKGITPAPTQDSGTCKETDGSAMVKRALKERSFDNLLEMARQGDAEAAYLVGFAYRDGIAGGTKNLMTAADWWRLSIARGYSDAAAALGRLYCCEEGGLKNMELANSWYRTGRALRSGKSVRNLAYSYLFGGGVTADFQVATTLFKEAGELKMPCAWYDLGYAYSAPEHKHVDRKISRDFFEKGSSIGDHDATIQFANSYFYGLREDHSDRNPERARDILMDATKKGCSACWGSIAYLYASDALVKGGSQELVTAAYESGYHDRDDASTLEYGLRLAGGVGVTRNLVGAIPVFEQATRSSDPAIANDARGSLGFALKDSNPLKAMTYLRDVVAYDSSGDPASKPIFPGRVLTYARALINLIEQSGGSGTPTPESLKLRQRYGGGSGTFVEVPMICAGRQNPLNIYLVDWDRPNDETALDNFATWLKVGMHCTIPSLLLDRVRAAKKQSRETKKPFVELAIAAIKDGSNPRATVIAK